jgi:hypothetical protein
MLSDFAKNRVVYATFHFIAGERIEATLSHDISQRFQEAYTECQQGGMTPTLFQWTDKVSEYTLRLDLLAYFVFKRG